MLRVLRILTIAVASTLAFVDHNAHVYRALEKNDAAGLLIALESRSNSLRRAVEAGDLATALALARGAPRERRSLPPSARALFSDEWVSLTVEEVTTLRGTPLLGQEPPHC